jgi:hypothetical protein
VLGHPFLLIAQPTGDAQRQTFFTQQRIAAVARAEGPDGVVQWKMADVAPIRIHIADAVQAARKLIAFAQLFPGHIPHAGHDSH